MPKEQRSIIDMYSDNLKWATDKLRTLQPFRDNEKPLDDLPKDLQRDAIIYYYEHLRVIQKRSSRALKRLTKEGESNVTDNSQETHAEGE